METVWEEYWRNLFYNGQEAERDEVEHHAANTVNMMVGSGGGIPLTGGGDSDGENSDPTAELNEVAVVNCVPTLIGGMYSLSTCFPLIVPSIFPFFFFSFLFFFGLYVVWESAREGRPWLMLMILRRTSGSNH